MDLEKLKAAVELTIRSMAKFPKIIKQHVDPWVILQTQTPPVPKSDTPPDSLPQRSQSSSSSSSQAPSQATPFTAAGTAVEASVLPQAGDQNLSE